MSVIPTSALSGTVLSPIYREIQTPRLARPISRFTGLHVHFVGVGGSGMSGLARMLIDCGALVTGSDRRGNRQTAELMQMGAQISFEQRGELLSPTTDLVVRTAAVKDDHTEMKAADELGLQSIKYAQLLGEVMRERHGVAIAGTHGKSTTTAMTAFALLKCGLDPSFVVGGIVPQLGGVGSRSGSGEAFVAEACEYDRSFHNLAPRVAVITNIEEDHLDCYKDIYEIIESFRKFSHLVPSDGLIIANGRDANVAKAVMDTAATIESVSLGDDTIWSTHRRGIVAGCHQGQVWYRGRPVTTLRLSVAGEHNLLNATMALAAAHACGADINEAAEALGQFKGVDRRMTAMGSVNGATVVDDYAHHPTEVRTTLQALRERYAPRRLICVFQPHQHSRTRHLLEDFATSFSAADEVVMPDIYFVRDSEEERRSVRAADLVHLINAGGHNALHIPSFGDIVAHLRATVRSGDLVVTMGAGNVNEIANDLVDL
ncbi:MAG: UDP-N-acetylmuramate--L-alanine ligase [Burkholderiales bacterium]|nr:UDP-N-acetylmuramate--L-alanine ligase [Phycisphaerae bacterium]